MPGEETTDIGVLQRVLADDFVNLVPRGVGPGKAELIANLRSKAGQASPYRLETKDMRVYVLGDTAVAAYEKLYIAKENENIAHEQTTHVFTKDHGVWTMRIARATVCPDEPGE